MLKAAKDRATWLNLLYTAVAVKKNKIKKRKEDINFLSIVPLKTTTSPCSPDAQNKTYIQAVFLMWFVAEFMEPFFLIIFGVYSRRWRWVIGELDNLPDVDEMCMKRWRKKKKSVIRSWWPVSMESVVCAFPCALTFCLCYVTDGIYKCLVFESSCVFKRLGHNKLQRSRRLKTPIQRDAFKVSI